MNIQTIKSVLNESHTCYCSVDGFYDNGLVAYCFGQYDTYGDGTTQHSHAYPVGANKFTDFCLSMAKFILENPDVTIHSYQVGLSDTIPQDAYDFLRSIKYSDTTPRWYSLQLRKVTKSDSARYDKRYEQVPSWADGSPKSAFDLYWRGIQSRKTLIERYHILSQFRELSGGSFYKQDECEPWIVELTGDHCQAFRALQSAVQCMEAKDWAQRLIESAIHNSTPKPAPVVESTEQPVAA